VQEEGVGKEGEGGGIIVLSLLFSILLLFLLMLLRTKLLGGLLLLLEMELLLWLLLKFFCSVNNNNLAFNSQFSWVTSFNCFSSLSSCNLYSKVMVVRVVTLYSRVDLSDPRDPALTSRSVIYSFFLCRERAADCLFFNNRSCLFRALSSSDFISTPPRILLFGLERWFAA